MLVCLSYSQRQQKFRPSAQCTHKRAQDKLVESGIPLSKIGRFLSLVGVATFTMSQKVSRT